MKSEFVKEITTIGWKKIWTVNLVSRESGFGSWNKGAS
jgi:hypothetical protein